MAKETLEKKANRKTRQNKNSRREVNMYDEIQNEMREWFGPFGFLYFDHYALYDLSPFGGYCGR